MITDTLPTEERRAPRRASPSHRFAKRVLVRRLAGLRDGVLRLVDDEGSVDLGTRGELEATVRVLDTSFYHQVVSGGSVGAGEAYRDGRWQTNELVPLVRLLTRNRDLLDGLDDGAARFVRWLTMWAHRMKPNSLRGSRRNVAAHYDLSNELFETFLDRRLMYSAAIYPHDAATLDEASTHKLDRILKKLELGPADHLLEIGSGWGGLAIHAALGTGCRVTTVTVSAEQHAYAERRVRAAGIADRVTVLNRDYRELRGEYSKLVSVEMVEAVGDGYLDGYFRCCNRLLAPGGLFLLQAITIEDHRYRRALGSVDFIRKHIFPGSFIPSVSRLVAGSARDTELRLVHLEDIGADYARTLEAWRARFLGNASRVAALGFDDRFCRLWEFYLAYCEGGFRECSIGDAQMLFAKSPYRGRPWRAAPSEESRAAPSEESRAAP